MFEICRRSQHDLLDRHGVACMFDVDSGRVPAWMFENFRMIVETLLTDIANDVDRKRPRRRRRRDAALKGSVIGLWRSRRISVGDQRPAALPAGG